MNRDKLVEACGGGGRECDYLLEVARRLERHLGEWLSLTDCFALMFVITENSFKYVDGFVLNDDEDPATTLWLADAAVLAASFLRDQSHSWEWLKSKYPECAWEQEDYRAAIGRIHQAIVQSTGTGQSVTEPADPSD